MILKELKSLWLDYHRHNVTPRTNQYASHLLNKHFAVFDDVEVDDLKSFDIYQIARFIESKHESKRAEKRYRVCLPIKKTQ